MPVIRRAAGPIIAVLDDDVLPEAVEDVVWQNPGEAQGVNGVDDDGNGIVDDVHGAVFTRPILDDRKLRLGDVAGAPQSYSWHGTGVAMIAADMMRASHTGQLLGVGFAVTDDVLTGFERAVDYLVKLRGRGENVRVANASFGLTTRSPADQARWRAAVEKLEAAGIVLVCALENPLPNQLDARLQPMPPTTPNQMPAGLTTSNIVRVGMTDAAGVSFHATADVVAPGIDVTGTTAQGARLTMSGSSAAVPQVSAALAAWFNAYPNATPAQARSALMRSSNGGKLDVAGLLRTPPR